MIVKARASDQAPDSDCFPRVRPVRVELSTGSARAGTVAKLVPRDSISTAADPVKTVVE